MDRFPRLKAGDYVKIELPLVGGIKAAFMMYTIPLIALAIGMTIGYYTGMTETGAVLLGLGLMALVYIVIALNNKRFEKNPVFTGEITQLDLENIIEINVNYNKI